MDQEETPSSDTVYLVTGINPDHSSSMLDGSLTPHLTHMDRLVAYFGEDVASMFNREGDIDVEHTKTTSGKPPRGYKLMSYVPSRAMEQGDLIAFKDEESKRTTISWSRIDSIEKRPGRVIFAVGEHRVEIGDNRPVRIARSINGNG